MVIEPALIGTAHIVDDASSNLVARCGQDTQNQNSHYRASATAFIQAEYNRDHNRFTQCPTCTDTLTIWDVINSVEI